MTTKPNQKDDPLVTALVRVESYVPGRNVRVQGKRLRFAITILEGEAFADNEKLLI